MVCCVETVGQSKTRQQVGSTFYLNHSAAGQSAAQKTTHVIVELYYYCLSLIGQQSAVGGPTTNQAAQLT